MNVLLTKEYRGQKPGTLLQNVSAADAGAIEAMGLGEKLPDDEPVKPAKKGEKGDKE